MAPAYGEGLSREKPATGTRVGNRVTVNITITDDLLAAVRAIAEEEQLSFAAVTRRLLRKAIKMEKESKA